jgi:hypothetical protein
MGAGEKKLATGQIGNVASTVATGIGPGTIAGAGKGIAGYMQGKALDKAVAQGEISPQGAQQMMNAGNKPKGKSKGPKKLIKSANKPQQESNTSNLYTEQMFNPAQVANELVQNVLADPTGGALQQIAAIAPSIQAHPDIVAFTQQLQGQAAQAQGGAAGIPTTQMQQGQLPVGPLPA